MALVRGMVGLADRVDGLEIRVDGAEVGLTHVRAPVASLTVKAAPIRKIRKTTSVAAINPRCSATMAGKEHDR